MQVKIFSTLILLLFLSGCATVQHPVSLNTELLTNPQARIGIIVDTPLNTSLVFPGADCLLCLASASAFNSELSKFAKSLSTEELKTLSVDLSAVFKSRNIDSLVIEEPLEIDKLPKTKKLGDGFAKRDFSVYAEKYQLQHLVVIDIHRAGLIRSYSSYIPLGPPQAEIWGDAYMVDLTTHKYDWYLPFEMYLSASGKWDEPPEFPGLTNAYYQLLERVRDHVMDPFSKPQ